MHTLGSLYPCLGPDLPPSVIPASKHFLSRHEGQFFRRSLSMVQSFLLAHRYFCFPASKGSLFQSFGEKRAINSKHQCLQNVLKCSDLLQLSWRKPCSCHRWGHHNGSQRPRRNRSGTSSAVGRRTPWGTWALCQTQICSQIYYIKQEHIQTSCKCARVCRGELTSLFTDTYCFPLVH